MFKLFKKVISLAKSKYELSKYNDYTIAEYFRKRGTQIGDDCFIGLRQMGSEPYLIKIGNCVAIASTVHFVTHNVGWIYRDKIPDMQVFGKIVIEDNCLIGSNAIILPNVTIGENSIISAGAVVVNDIPPNSIAVGNPARVIGNTQDYFEKAREIWEKQRPEGYLNEMNPLKKYTPIEFNALRQKPENVKLLRSHLTKQFWGKAF